MYVSEALENVATMNESLLKLEENPKEREHIDIVFRAAHTIKGMSATMGYDKTRELCKNIENEFDKIRKGETQPNPNLISAILKCIDLLQQMIQDEKKDIDLEPYLHLLQNPEEASNFKTNGEVSEVGKNPTIRVKMTDLDSLVNLVGELVIAKMSLEQISKNSSSEKTRQVIMTLDRLITDLQYQSMKLRLVPIDLIFNRFPRLVRDLSTNMKKNIKLELDAGGLEMDRTVLDAITDPLLHMLRNSIDHAMESPEERTKAGKNSTGTIKLTAYRVEDKLAIRIDDDGKGIDLEAIKTKAIDKKIITSQEAEKMTTDDIILLIGSPGLSTAKVVTDVSGRGVGMDVVKTQVESVGGNLKIETRKGKGTSITLTIPSSLSIIGGLLVKVSDQKFVIPLSSITTTISMSKNEIKSVHGREVIVLRDQLVPLIRVSNVLKLNDKKNNLEKETIVIVDKGGKPYGLIVDSFERKQQIVIKKLDESADSTSSFTNATILPDGSVALILDPGQLIK